MRPVLPPVLHRRGQPISAREFRDALLQATPPRYPEARCLGHRQVALAISGGVDSMALAYLCAAVRREYPWIRVGDAQVSRFSALIVDHGLRPESSAEALAVANAVRHLGHPASVCQLPKRLLASYPHPETAARQLRYRLLGRRCTYARIFSLLLAHHADDQYETVLLRLLSGYGLHGGIRGLRGMRPATDIPECRGFYGAHQSGLADDQRTSSPYYFRNPSPRDRRDVKLSLRADADAAALADAHDRFHHHSGFGDAAAAPPDSDLDLWRRYYLRYQYYLSLGPSPNPGRPDFSPSFDPLRFPPPPPPPPPPLPTEDLGIYAYRPLLPFSKDRLVATCEANNVPWFEDATNSDPSLTMRNAIRHLARHHPLPVALQPPSILRLAARCHALASAHEAEARRFLIRHRILVRFHNNTGTAVIRLPPLSPLTLRGRPRPGFDRLPSSRYAAASREQRRLHLRSVAALVVQNLLRLLTPEDHVTPVTQLHGVVDMLFPDLAAERRAAAAFTICGVYFAPLQEDSSPQTWFVSRAPHAAGRHPAVWFPAKGHLGRHAQPGFAPWSRWLLYDGRYWLRVRNRMRVNVEVRPFAVEHARPLRDALGSGPDAAVLMAALKQHAPGKARYTLPALYVRDDYMAEVLRRRDGQEDDYVINGTGDGEDRDDRDDRDDGNADDESDSDMLLVDSPPPPDDDAHDAPHSLRLLALPTLGIHIPGVQHWLQWEVRYRKVDTALLRSCGIATAEW